MTRHRPARGQRGVALITSLLLLIVVTIMALSMFRSYGIQERIAGNTRDKQRALNAAVSAQQYAESWLVSGAAPATGACVGIVSSNTGQVCSNPLASVTTVPWTSGGVPVGVTYTPFTSNSINNVTNVIKAGNATADVYQNLVLTQSASYFAAPVFYITDVGPNKDPSTPGEVYQIDALGYGGTANTVAVVESTFLITTNSAHGGDK
jgi:type IV pilus assembly protein PilX